MIERLQQHWKKIVVGMLLIPSLQFYVFKASLLMHIIIIHIKHKKNINFIFQNSIDDFNGLQKLQNLKWSIPLSYTTKSELNFNETRPVYMMNEYSVSLSTNHPISDNDWIIFNLQFTGILFNSGIYFLLKEKKNGIMLLHNAQSLSHNYLIQIY